MREIKCLISAFQYKGYFHLPNCEKSVAGILSYNPSDGVKLELIGGIKDEIQSLFSQREIRCIWGEIENGDLITLFHCTSSFHLCSDCSFILETYKCNHMIIGANVDSYEEPLYNNIHIKIEWLSYWCPPQVLSNKVYSDKISTSLETTSCYKQIIQVRLDNCRKLSINGSGTYSSGIGNHSISYGQETIAVIEYDEPQSIISLERDAQKFCDFLSFAALDLQIRTSTCIFDDDKPIQIISKPLFIPSVRSEQRKIFYQFLFPYKDIKSEFPRIIQKWYSDKLATPIIGHLIDSITSKKVFTENDFLNIVQALDGYYKRFINIHSSERFATRLDEMFVKYKDLKIFKGDTFDSTAIAHTRNYFSHLFDESTLCGDEIRDGENLYRVSNIMRKLLICYIMEYVGFTKEEISRISSKSNNQYLVACKGS